MNKKDLFFIADVIFIIIFFFFILITGYGIYKRTYILVYLGLFTIFMLIYSILPRGIRVYDTNKMITIDRNCDLASVS